MRLASLKQGRDGQLVVVSRDLSRCVSVPAIAQTMQAALDHWTLAAPALQAIADALEDGHVPGEIPFDQTQAASPLPRSYAVMDGSAYLNHVRLVRRARGAEMPPEFLHDPLMYQAVSDTTLNPRDPILVADESFGIDFESEVAVIVGDVPMGVSADDAGAYICLIMLMNDVSLRNLIPAELAKGFGFLQAKPPSAFSPVALTPSALGNHWRDGKLHLSVITHINDREVGRPNAGADMQFDFPTLIAHAARTRPLQAGTIIGSGTVSNEDRNTGVGCLAETRMIEIIEQGAPKTPFLSFGDRVRIEAVDDRGASLFGTIEQVVTPYQYQRESHLKRA